jgi:hypothetical protein
MQSSRTTKISKDEIRIDHKLGFTIIKPSNRLVTIPLFCDVCSLAMSGELDTAYYEKYSCCSSCGMKWADINQSKWQSGWRPKREEIKKEIDRRQSLPVSFSL